jgi:carboxypeptidase T
MRLVLLLVAFTFLFNTAPAQTQEKYSRAKIYLDAGNHTMSDLSALGLAVDHGEYKKNTFFVSDFSRHEIKKARKAGFKVEIVIADVAKYYEDQNKKKTAGAEKTTAAGCAFPVLADPAHFHLGTYGGYFTYTEMLRILDSMHTLYPTLISTRQQIDTFHSVLDSPIYWIRVSDNPNVDQPAKPQMLYTALHHAREPGSLSSTIYYLWYLLENYSTDARIKTIIDNTELYFIPCVNPDGYLYNIATNPGGGGLWRKNRRNNMDGTYGIDLNRNYGYKWGYDNIGSSPRTMDDTYRGPSAFSEPETRAVKWMADNHHFKLCLNFHSYNNDILYPWGYIPSYQTVDSNWFFAYGEYITTPNHYRYGTTNQTLNYVANGVSDDWMYGDTLGRLKTYAFTPEVGSIVNGFYPPAYQIIPDCQNNLPTNLNTASILLPFATIVHTDKKIQVQTSGYLHYNLKRLGFPDTATFTVGIVPLDSWLTVSATPKVYTSLTLLQQVTDSISYALSPSTPNGQLVSYVLQVYNGYYYMRDTVQFYYGKYYTLATPRTASLTDWTNSGWGVCTSSYYTPPASIRSSLTGEGNYSDNTDITINPTAAIDLTHATHAYLQFYTKWAIETDYDYVTVNAVDASGTATPLCGLHTRAQPLVNGGFPLYDGQQPNWVREEMDLSDYLGTTIHVQFQLVSDAHVNDKGYFFDDVNITTIVDSPQSVGAITSGNVSLNIYPNPAQEQITISVTGYTFTHPLHAVLYDAIGREAMSFTIGQPVLTRDINQLPGGMYYLKVSDNGMALPVVKVDVIR